MAKPTADQQLAAEGADNAVVRAYLECLVEGREVPGVLAFAFTKVAPFYGERWGISYAAWRKMGVPAAVLRQAEIS